METSGQVRKMQVEHDPATHQVSYTWVTHHTQIDLSSYIGRHIEIQWHGQIYCQACGKNTRTSFNQGFCYPCFTKLARNDRCVMSPELCHFDKGTCREPEWGLAHCMQKHIVYLAWSSNLKVGLTKPSQIPIRWIDQGASHAIAVCSVRSRYHAGLVETFLKQDYADRTNWRKMLTGEAINVDLLEAYKDVVAKIQSSDLPSEVKDGVEIIPPEVMQFTYPLPFQGPIKSLDLAKEREVKGHLLGIKGQYLLLDSGVINIRKYTSYDISLSVSEDA